MSQLVTGEAVVLQVRLARMPTRALACAIDFTLQLIALGLLLALLFAFLLTEASEALAAAIVIVVVLLVLVGYRAVMETLTRGRTVGKMALGLRVVRDDGSSIRFRHALVRSLVWLFVDFAPWFGSSPGIVASLMNKQGKRIGDMVAGTVVVRERHQPMASPPLFVPGHLVQWAQSLELARLSDELANTSREYLARYTELEPAARESLGNALAFRVGGVTAPAPPVMISAPAFLSAVLAERRRRELARLTPQFTPYGTAPRPYGAPPNPFGTPPSPYGVPPSPYGVPPGQYGAPPQPQANPYRPPGAPNPSQQRPQPPYQPRPSDRPHANPDGWHAPGGNQHSPGS